MTKEDTTKASLEARRELAAPVQGETRGREWARRRYRFSQEQCSRSTSRDGRWEQVKQVGHILSDLAERELIDEAQAVARRYDVTVEEMVGRRRLAGIAAARHAMWATLYDRGHWSYSRIAEMFGRNHATVIAGVRAHATRELAKVDRVHQKELAHAHAHAVDFQDTEAGHG